MEINNEAEEVRVFIEANKLDMNNADELDTEVDNNLRETTETVVIDLKNVKLVDSSGVGKILKLQSNLREAGIKLKLVNVNDHYVQKLMNLVHLDKLVDIEKS